MTVIIAMIAALAVTMPRADALDPNKSMAELLGYDADDRVLIINGDDFGMSHATNVAIFDAFENGVLTSATLMMPTAWVKEVANWAKEHPEADIGVHLTHTSEWKGYRWAPILGRDAVPGLLAPDRYIWPDCEDVWEHATPDEAEAESRAQIDYAMHLGIDVTHIDSHMGTMQLDEDFWKRYLKLSVDYQLPQRQAAEEMYAQFGAAGRKQAERQAGVPGPDYLLYSLPAPSELAERKEFYNNVLRNLKPGLTEMYLHPAVDGPEMQAISGTHRGRDGDYRWLIDPDTKKLIEELDIKLIGYRELRDFMRQAD